MYQLLIDWILKAFRENPGRVSMLLAFSLLTSLADGLSISLLIPLLSTLFDGGALVSRDQGMVAAALGRFADLAGRANRLELIAGSIVVLVAFRALLAHLSGLNVAQLSGKISYQMRSRVFANLLGVDFQYICVTDNGKLINTLDGETWKVTDAIFSVFDLFTSACMIVAFGTLLLLLSWQLTLLMLILVLIVSALRRTIDSRTRIFGERLVRAAEDLSMRACELLYSMRMTRAFGREAYAQEEYQRASMRVFQLDLASSRLKSAASNLQEVAYAAIIAIALVMAINIGLGQATLIAFLALLHRVQPNIKAIDETRTSLIQATESINAVTRLLELELWSAHASGRHRLEHMQGDIAFENVTFSYAGKAFERRNALEDISFTIPLGRITAFVGASGAGKSTITNLLFRFHDPEVGRITVDDVPLNELDLDWWRGRLAISGQDTDLISGTLRENIAYSRPDATYADIEEAARAADIHAFIAALPLGYDTEVGERGLLLSGGQRQRIELARALLRKDSILILDEATNALDSLTEAEVFKTLDAIAGTRTVIIIAHRLSTTRMADKVIVLSHGRVAEEGTPGELYRSAGVFSKMVQLQELTYLINDPPMIDANAVDGLQVANSTG